MILQARSLLFIRSSLDQSKRARVKEHRLIMLPPSLLVLHL